MICKLIASIWGLHKFAFGDCGMREQRDCSKVCSKACGRRWS